MDKAHKNPTPSRPELFSTVAAVFGVATALVGAIISYAPAIFAGGVVVGIGALTFGLRRGSQRKPEEEAAGNSNTTIEHRETVVMEVHDRHGRREPMGAG